MADDFLETALPNGKMAEVATYLERFDPPAGAPPDGPWRLERWPKPDVARYLALFREVGEEWLWASRLDLGREALARILADPLVEVHALMRGGDAVGLIELDFREPVEAQIQFFGIVRSEFGTGAGRWLMQAGLVRAFRDRPRRVWLHTCTTDHPFALQFYRSQGFRPYRRAIRVFTDPRVLGVLPHAAGAHIPLILPDVAGAPAESPADAGGPAG